MVFEKLGLALPQTTHPSSSDGTVAVLDIGLEIPCSCLRKVRA